MKSKYLIGTSLACLLAAGLVAGCSGDDSAGGSDNTTGGQAKPTSAASGSDHTPEAKKDDSARYAPKPLVSLDRYQDVTTVINAYSSNNRARDEWPNYQSPAAYFWSRVDDAKRKKYAFTFVQDLVFDCIAQKDGFEKRDCIKAHYDEAARIANSKRDVQYVRMNCNGWIRNYDFQKNEFPSNTCTEEGTSWRFTNDFNTANRYFVIKRPVDAKPLKLNFDEARNREIQKLIAKAAYDAREMTVYGHIVDVEADWGDPQFLVTPGAVEIAPDAVKYTLKGVDGPVFVWSLAENGPVDTAD